uniref:Reverse transcriptase zinc-binding domain-containing protein n=1 Tax=Cajanus cajan TaxID=3821 RepID=A0A151UFE2_CAJCA
MNKEETTSHLFFECEVSFQLWMACFNWLGLNSVMHNCCVQILEQFYGFHYCSAKYHNCWILIWLSVIKIIWLARNDLMFSSKIIHVSEMLNLVQLRSSKWLRARFLSLNYDFFSWSNFPGVCLS